MRSILFIVVLSFSAAVIAQDNPGLGTLDQATEAKLQSQTAIDLGKVILLCQQAKKEGLSGENLKYCDQLLASSQLQRGMYFAKQLLETENRHDNWKVLRQSALADLENAVQTIKNQIKAYLLIAQLNLLEDGDAKRAAEALDEAQRQAKDEPALLVQIVSLKASIEKDPQKREKILASAAGAGNPQLTLLHALTLFEINKKAEAVKVLQKLLVSEKDSPEISERVFKILAERGEFEAALKILDEQLKTAEGGQKNRMLLQKAGLLTDMKRYSEALPLLNDLRKQMPEGVEILILRSGVYSAMGSKDSALKDIDAALRLRTNHPMLLLQKIKIYVAANQFDDALAVLKDLESAEPANSEFKAMETEFLLKLKRYDEAVDVVQNVLKENPDAPQWLDLLVAVYTEQKVYDKAVKIVEEQRKKKPDDEQWTRKFAALLTIQKKYAEAEKFVDDLIKKAPDKNTWVIFKASLLAEQKKEAAAVETVDAFLQKHPGDLDAALTAVQILSEAKKNKDARKRLNELLDKDPENLRLVHISSQLSISMGLHQEAVQALEKIVKAEPNDALALNNLSWLYSTSPLDTVRNGKRALELALKACTLTDYREAFIVSTLAAAYAETLDFDKAREWSKKTIEMVKADEKTLDKTDEKAVAKHKELLESVQKELDSYKKDAPYREALSE
ncbi:MAG: tetratricopeptide repeat protein [Planctomycetaceae bacterium]|jgi:predicted Zn-dependent protease|nr:tetratricopeptide repeat protein [Planctomycetaceae bacterium]